MRKMILAVLFSLLATASFAQIGSPGMSSPPFNGGAFTNSMLGPYVNDENCSSGTVAYGWPGTRVGLGFYPATSFGKKTFCLRPDNTGNNILNWGESGLYTMFYDSQRGGYFTFKFTSDYGFNIQMPAANDVSAVTGFQIDTGQIENRSLVMKSTSPFSRYAYQSFYTRDPGSASKYVQFYMQAASGGSLQEARLKVTNGTSIGQLLIQPTAASLSAITVSLDASAGDLNLTANGSATAKINLANQVALVSLYPAEFIISDTAYNNSYTLDDSTRFIPMSDKVRVVIAESGGPTLVSGTVDICGYVAPYTASCEALNIGAGAGTYDTTGDFVEVVTVKSSNVAAISGDESITVRTKVLTASSLTVGYTTNAVDGETFTLYGLAYNPFTFRTVVASNGDVKIGASADATFANLVCAINDSGCTEGAGQDYMAAAADTSIGATQNAGADTITLTALLAGSIGDNYTAYGTNWPGGAFTGGAGSILIAPTLPLNHTATHSIQQLSLTAAYTTLFCMDLTLGCDFEPLTTDNGRYAIFVNVGAGPVRFTDSAGMSLAGGTAFTAGTRDVIQLLFVKPLSTWVELSRANN